MYLHWYPRSLAATAGTTPPRQLSSSSRYARAAWMEPAAPPARQRRPLEPALGLQTADEAWRRLKAAGLPPAAAPRRRYVTDAGAAAAGAPALPPGLTLPSVLLRSLGEPPQPAERRSAGAAYVEVGSYKKRSRARSAAAGGGRLAATGLDKGAAAVAGAPISTGGGAPASRGADADDLAVETASAAEAPAAADATTSDSSASATASEPAASAPLSAAEPPPASLRTRRWKFKGGPQAQAKDASSASAPGDLFGGGAQRLDPGEDL